MPYPGYAGESHLFLEYALDGSGQVEPPGDGCYRFISVTCSSGEIAAIQSWIATCRNCSEKDGWCRDPASPSFAPDRFLCSFPAGVGDYRGCGAATCAGGECRVEAWFDCAIILDGRDPFGR